MTPTTYRVRRATVPELSEAAGVWTRSLSTMGDPSQRIRWFYQDAPEGTGSAVLLDAVGPEGTRVVGASGLGVRAFAMRGRRLRAGLMANLAVEERHRTLLPALRLLKEVRAAGKAEGLDFLYGFPNEKAIATLLRAGYVKLGVMSRHARVLRHAPYVRRVISLPVVPSLAGAALDSARLMSRTPRGVRALSRYRLRVTATPPEGLDGLFAEASPAYESSGSGRRAGSAGGSSRPASPPRGPPRCAPGAAPCARTPSSSVEEASPMCVNLFGHRDALQPLLELLALRMLVEGATSLSLRLLADPTMVDVLRASGFETRSDERSIIVDAGSALDAGSLPSFHLTDFDEDA